MRHKVHSSAICHRTTLVSKYSSTLSSMIQSPKPAKIKLHCLEMQTWMGKLGKQGNDCQKNEDSCERWEKVGYLHQGGALGEQESCQFSIP